MKKLIIALVCMAFTVNAQLVGVIRVDVQGTATNSTGISGAALGTVTGIANTVIAPYTNLPAVIAAGDLASTNYTDAVAAGKMNTNAAHSSLSGIQGAGTLHVTLADTNKIATAWQNPASATNWTWTSDGVSATMTGYSGPPDVVIPDRVNNLPVTGIGSIFADVAITSISGGANVTSIVAFAFQFCAALTSATLPAATSIGDGAFYACTALTNVTLKAAMSIGVDAFSACTALTSANLTAATSIGDSAFANCAALTSATLPAATSIGINVFDTCLALTSVSFGQNAPADATNVYLETPNVTNYVTSSTATGWGATWNGRPVVRLPVTAQTFTGGGTGITNIPIAGVSGLTDALAGKVSTTGDITRTGTLGGSNAVNNSDYVTLGQFASSAGAPDTYYLATAIFTNGVAGATNRTLARVSSPTAWTITVSKPAGFAPGDYIAFWHAQPGYPSAMKAGNQIVKFNAIRAGSGGSQALSLKFEGYIFNTNTLAKTEYIENAESVALGTTLTTPQFSYAAIPNATNFGPNEVYMIAAKVVTANNTTSVTFSGGSNSISSVTIPTLSPTALLTDAPQDGKLYGRKDGAWFDNIVESTPAGIAAAGGIVTNSILGQGETDLGTGLTVTICNATASYYAAPTGTWTLAMCASPLRYPRDLMIVSTNGSLIPSYIKDLRTGSAGTTNLYYLRPSGTGTNWTLWGKSL